MTAVAAQLAIGAAVLVARAGSAPTPWKTLERRYGRSRVQLWRYAKRVRAELAGPERAAPVDPPAGSHRQTW